MGASSVVPNEFNEEQHGDIIKKRLPTIESTEKAEAGRLCEACEEESVEVRPGLKAEVGLRQGFGTMTCHFLFSCLCVHALQCQHVQVV